MPSPLGAMEGRVLLCVFLLAMWVTLGRGQGDFDLADALDDPDPTKKPSPGLYPPLPRPQPGHPGSGGHLSDEDSGHYPPRPRPPSGGGGYGGHDPSYDTHGNGYGGSGHTTYGDHQGNTVAKVVSPIVSVVVVTLVGAAVSYYNRRRGCCARGTPENI